MAGPGVRPILLSYLMADEGKLAFGNGEGEFGHFAITLGAGHLLDACRAGVMAGETPQLDILAAVPRETRLAADCLVRALLLDDRSARRGLAVSWSPATPWGGGEGDLLLVADDGERSLRNGGLGEAFEGAREALDVLGMGLDVTAGPRRGRAAWSVLRKFARSELRRGLLGR